MFRRSGLSPVVANVIITGVMLTVVAVAIYYSTSLIDANRQALEYESAKELLTYAATALEQVALGTGGARYVRFSLTSTMINFESLPVKLRVVVSGGGTFSIELPFRRLSVCGGPLVTTVERVLYPEGGSLSEINTLAVGAGEPIVLVYERFDERACAYLEVRRVRATYSGVTYVSEGNSQVPYNFYTIHLVNITFGKLGGAGTIPLVIRNNGVKVYEYKFNSPTLTVTASLDRVSSSIPLRGASARASIIVVKVSQLEVSTG